MHILFLTDNFPPEVNAPASRTFEHCMEWIKLGADITVITCAPNFPQGKVYSGYVNKIYSHEIINGINVIRVWSYITKNEGFFKRMLDYLSFCLSSFIAGLFIRADIIIATSPQFFTTWAAYGISKVKRKPWIFELRDLWPESIKSVGAMSGNLILGLLEKIELSLYKDATLVIALTDAFKKNLVSRGIAKEKIHVVTNGSNIDLFRPQEKDNYLLRELSLEAKFVIGYIGTHGMAHGLEFIVNAIANISDENIHFLFIGDGARKNAVVKLADDKGIKNTTFLPPIAREEVPRYISVIDVMLVPLIKSDTFKTVIPSKIFEGAAMRKPILLGVEGEALEIIERYEAGICYEPENERNFIEQVTYLKNNKDLYKRLKRGCERLALAFDRKELAKRMFYLLKDTVKGIR